MEKKTVYEALGGQESVYLVITKMYEKILSDKRVSFFFDDIDVNTLRHMTLEFVSMAFGAPHHYNGKSLSEAHKGLLSKGLNDRHFDIVLHHLSGAMQEIGTAPDIIQEGIVIIESTRNDILGK